MDEDVVDMFPQLKEVREYLLDNYPLTREEQEKQLFRTKGFESLPISFYYDDRMENGEYIKQVTTNLFFEKTVTKKQMVEAINYVSEKMKEIFLEDEEITVHIVAFVGYTEDGILQENLYLETEAFSLEYKRNASENVKWEIRTAPNKWIPFDPNGVQEGEKPRVFAEESAEPKLSQEEAPKEEPAPASIGLGGAKLSELKDYLSSADIEEYSLGEEYGTYMSKGTDPTKTYKYIAFIKSDKETIEQVTYMVIKKENLTNDEYLKMCKVYLTMGVTFGYKGMDTDEAASFIENNMETVLNTGKTKIQTIGTFSFTIGYLNNTASLTILNLNEK